MCSIESKNVSEREYIVKKNNKKLNNRRYTVITSLTLAELKKEKHEVKNNHGEKKLKTIQANQKKRIVNNIATIKKIGLIQKYTLLLQNKKDVMYCSCYL
jgi:hypothetical protein